MERLETQSSTVPMEQTQDANKTESAEDFQKFIYELFDKNGILNDLRAYLRGHIVNLLKNSQTGDPPSCQKNFTQRLEPQFQALNTLVAEYLLSMEFSYSLSVFVSEIPLANMVFDFSKSLMDLGTDGEVPELRFNANDVWSILNYLGIKCDSEHANNVIDMYKMKKSSPLLLCILKCVHLYNVESAFQANSANSYDESASSSSRSSPVEERRRAPTGRKCKHHDFCKTCRARFSRLREKYVKKKNRYLNNIKELKVNPQNVEHLMKKFGVMERNHIDEMFEQLKSVYEAEVNMIKTEQEEQIKRSLASHAMHFQQRENELEESFKAREASLEESIEHKKRFLWGLARGLRAQHSQMTKAMQAVKAESERLAKKEQNLKTQLSQAQEVLKIKGEDMRQQISHELVILEKHLESMKSERDVINRERFELDRLRSNSEIKLNKMNNIEEMRHKDLKAHYEQLKEELGVLKKYLERSKFEPKCVIEQGTITDVHGVNSRIKVVMNNEIDRHVASQVVNDLKKQKNVNFGLDDEEEQEHIGRSCSPSSTEAGDAALARLAADNRRLRRGCAQQSAHISELTARAARLQAALRPHTAPAAVPTQGLSGSVSSNAFGWCKGAGEELSFYCNAQPQIVVPGDTVPFVGVMGERRTDSRRHLINQWRALRHRVSPPGKRGAGNRVPSRGRPSCMSSPPSTHHEMESRRRQDRDDSVAFRAARNNVSSKAASMMDSHKLRDKSPKSLLREAKEKLKSVPRTSASREKSPSETIREAKTRLRKLEIEAEAVERSYMDFRRRRELRNADNEEKTNLRMPVNMDPHYEDERAQHSQSQDPHPRKKNNSMKEDLDKYLMQYQPNLDVALNLYKNRNTAAEITTPIPDAYSEINRDEVPAPKDNNYLDKPPIDNYLDKPLSEFRKLYMQPIRKTTNVETASKLQHPIELDLTQDSDCKELFDDTQAAIKKAKENTKRELEKFENEIGKIYNLQDEPTKETVYEPPEKCNEVNAEAKNLLRVEVEKTSELNDLKGTSDQSVLLVVERSIDSREGTTSGSESHRASISTRMTIVVSPKRKEGSNNTSERKSPDKSHRRLSVEEEAGLNRNDVMKAIYDSGDKYYSSNDIRLENDQVSVNEADDYADDLSGFERGIDSPVSLPKTSEDDNFWD